MQIRTIADLVAQWALIALLCLTPFFVIPVPWAVIGSSKLLLTSLFISIVLLAWLIARLSEGAFCIPRNGLLFAAAALPAAYSISAIAYGASTGSFVSGTGNQDTVAAMIILFAALALSAIVFSGNTSVQAATTVAIISLRALLFGGTAVIALHMARLVFPTRLGLGGVLSGSASSVVGSWHDLGILAGLIVFLAVLLWSSPLIARGYWKWLFIVPGACSFFLLIIVGVPDVWYVLGVLLFLFAIYRWGSARLHEKRSGADAFWRSAVALAVGLAAFAGGLGSGFIYDHLPAPLQVVHAEVRPSWQGTFAVGEKVFHGTGLIFGSGPNTFTRAWGEFKPMGVNQTQFWGEDFSTGVGLIPTSFITAGTLGVLAWVLFLLIFLKRTWALLRSKRPAPVRSLSIGILGACLSLLAFHILYTPGIGLSVLLFMLIGLWIAIENAYQPSHHLRLPLSTRPRWALVAPGVIFLTSIAIFAASVYSVRAALSNIIIGKSVSDYNRTGDIAHSLSLVREALVVYPGNDLAHRAAIQLGLLQLQQLVARGESANTTELQAALSQTIQEGLKAVSINSGDYQNWLALAGLYQGLGGVGVQGAYENALSAYQKAATANPTNPLPLIGAAQAAAAQKDATSSLQYLNFAIALKSNLPVAYYLRSQIEAGQGDFLGGIQDAKVAVSLAQEDPLGWYNLGAILYASGDYQTAIIALQQAVSLNNNYANALFVLALADDKAGDHQGAIAAMEEVVKLNPEDSTATQALANLRAGKSALPQAAASKNPR